MFLFKNGSLPIHIAALKGLNNLIKLFLKKRLPVNDKNTNNGNTPLHLAVIGEQLETISLLMKNHASLTEYNNSGQTPVKLALLSKKKDCF